MRDGAPEPVRHGAGEPEPGPAARSEAAGPVSTPPEAASLLAGDPVDVAPRLLGAVLTARVADDPSSAVAVRLTEVEAYRGETDPGSHAFRGRTARNAAMFGAAGAVYVLFRSRAFTVVKQDPGILHVYDARGDRVTSVSGFHVSEEHHPRFSVPPSEAKVHDALAAPEGGKVLRHPV